MVDDTKPTSGQTDALAEWMPLLEDARRRRSAAEQSVADLERKPGARHQGAYLTIRCPANCILVRLYRDWTPERRQITYFEARRKRTWTSHIVNLSFTKRGPRDEYADIACPHGEGRLSVEDAGWLTDIEEICDLRAGMTLPVTGTINYSGGWRRPVLEGSGSWWTPHST